MSDDTTKENFQRLSAKCSSWPCTLGRSAAASRLTAIFVQSRQRLRITKAQASIRPWSVGCTETVCTFFVSRIARPSFYPRLFVTVRQSATRVCFLSSVFVFYRRVPSTLFC